MVSHRFCKVLHWYRGSAGIVIIVTGTGATSTSNYSQHDDKADQAYVIKYLNGLDHVHLTVRTGEDYNCTGILGWAYLLDVIFLQNLSIRSLNSFSSLPV